MQDIQYNFTIQVQGFQAFCCQLSCGRATIPWRIATEISILSALCSPSDKLHFKSSLSTKTIKSTSLPFQGINDVHSGDSFSFSVFCISYSISDNILQKDLENTSCFLIDQPWNSLYTTSTGKTTDSWFCDTLNVVSKDLSVPLCTSFSQTFSSFSTAWHIVSTVFSAA